MRSVISLSGLSGMSAAVSSAAIGNAGMYTSGSCLAGGSFSTLFSGYRLVYRIDLGEVTPLGGVLTVTTCDLTRNNTVLYIGTGCPS